MIELASEGTTLRSFGALPRETSAVKTARWKKLWTSCSGPKSGRFRPWGAAVTLMGASEMTFAMESARGGMRRARYGGDEAAKRLSCLHRLNERRREEPPPLFKCLRRPVCRGMLRLYTRSPVSTRASPSIAGARQSYGCSLQAVEAEPLDSCRRNSSSSIAQGQLSGSSGLWLWSRPGYVGAQYTF